MLLASGITLIYPTLFSERIVHAVDIFWLEYHRGFKMLEHQVVTPIALMSDISRILMPSWFD